MTYKDVDFPKLCISEDEKKTFKDYCDAKGVYLHKHVYDVLLQYTDEVKYSELSGLIRYDKRLRDTLYIYLAALEEYFRSEVLNVIDIETSSKKVMKKLMDSIKEKTNFERSNLYFRLDVKFSKLVELLVKYCEKYKDKEPDLKAIKQLRNIVMHHNFLILQNHVDKDKVEKNIIKLRRRVALLYKYLPNIYKEGFKKEIEKLNIDTKNNIKLSDYLNLEGIEWNI